MLLDGMFCSITITAGRKYKTDDTDRRGKY